MKYSVCYVDDQRAWLVQSIHQIGPRNSRAERLAKGLGLNQAEIRDGVAWWSGIGLERSCFPSDVEGVGRWPCRKQSSLEKERERIDK